MAGRAVVSIVAYASLAASAGAVADGVGPLVVVSFDGMAFKHVSRAITDLPNIARLKEDGAWAEHGMLPSAISETFVSHHSMATGLYAESHGIVSNHMYDTNFNGTGETKKFKIAEEGGTGWFKGEPIWITAERHGVRAATYQWIGGEAYIKGRKATYRAAYNSSRPFSEGVAIIDGWLRGDDAPSLVMAYFPEPDRTGHNYGPDSPQYAAKVVEMDGLLRSIREMVEAHNGNLVLVSDHGMGDVSKHTPVYLDEVVPKALMDRVLISSVTPQLTVYTNTSADAAAVLAALKTVENPAIKLLSLREDLPDDMHLKGAGTRVGNVVAIARKGYSFMISRADDVCCDAEKGAFGCCGDHGYNNRNIEMRACFGAVGPAFRADSRIAQAPIRNVDLYGMFCRLLNVHPSPNNGTQVPFAGVLHKSPIRERWTAVEQGWNALWRPSGTDITIYPPTQEIFPGKRFDVQVTVPLDLPGIAIDDAGLASLRFEIRRADDTWESTNLGDICPGGPAAGGGVAQVIEDMRYSVVHYTQCVLQAGVVVRAVSGLRSASVHWDVDRRRRIGDGAKNVVLFVGDGMTLPMLTAARLLLQSGDRSQTLPTDSFSVTGTAFTHSLESIVTDSAAGASALNTGHRTVNGATGAYPDATSGTYHTDTDNPRVETLAEYLRREMGFKVGVVTTASVLDATPAGVWGHGSNRTRYTTLALQGLELQPDVVLGGGYRWFDPAVNAWQEENYAQDPEVLKRYTDAGYSLLRTDEDLRRHAADATAGSKTLGLFADKAMLTEKDRVVATPPASEQPSLSAMATSAVEMLTKSDGRFYLMVEAANIDKQAHACDSARMLSETLALQRAIADTQEVLRQKGLLDDTLLVVTSDHGTGGYDVYGTVDQDKAAATTNGKIRMYGHAEWPDWVADAESMTVGNWHDAQYTFAGMNGNHPAYTEDYKAKDLPVGWLGNTTLLASLEAAGGIPLANNLGGTAHVDAHNSAVHTATDVMVYASGPGAPRFAGGRPNTDVCFSILSALMPPAVPAPTNTDGGSTPAPVNQSDALLREIDALRAENAHLRSLHQGNVSSSKCAVVSPTVAVLLGVFITALLCLSAVIWRLYATAKATRESRSSTSAHWELEDLAVEGSNASEFGLGGSLTEHTPGL